MKLVVFTLCDHTRCVLYATQSAERDAAKLLDVAWTTQRWEGVAFCDHKERWPRWCAGYPSVCTIARPDFPQNFWQLSKVPPMESAHEKTPQDLSHGAALDLSTIEEYEYLSLLYLS
jgi:hypothetical protein